MPTEGRSFRLLFERWARRVRLRFAFGRALTGAAVGLLVGAGVSAALWQTRHGALRPAGAAVGVLGALVALAVPRRRRWADGDVALFLDARLGSGEAIATALELGPGSSAHAVVLGQATDALARATRASVRARMLRGWHAALPVGAATIGWISLAPLPPAGASPPAPPGAERVQRAGVEGLEKILGLAEVSARDDAQRARLKALADEAKKLRDKLKDGVEKREAQADIAKLRDGIQAEKLSLGDGEQRRGMESALGKLGENRDLARAQKALGDRDLVSLDEEMERLADTLEKADRARAQKTLEEAAEAARRDGAPGVAKALEEERRRFAEAMKRADKLRELAKELGDALGEDGRQALRDFNGRGGTKDERRLAEELDEALGGLTPEERKRLAQNLKKKLAEEPDGPSPSKRQLRELADALDTPEGRKQLEEELRRMAEAPLEGSEEGERQKKLGEAEDGAGEAERGLGGVPIPIPLPMPGPPGRCKGGEAQPGHTEGGGPGGDHQGVTGVVEGDDVKARAAARLNKGRSMPGVVMGRTRGKAGDTANTVGTGALGEAAAGEIGGVERSDVPEEYREQVGRYFRPR